MQNLDSLRCRLCRPFLIWFLNVCLEFWSIEHCLWSFDPSNTLCGVLIQRTLFMEFWSINIFFGFDPSITFVVFWSVDHFLWSFDLSNTFCEVLIHQHFFFGFDPSNMFCGVLIHRSLVCGVLEHFCGVLIPDPSKTFCGVLIRQTLFVQFAFCGVLHQRTLFVELSSNSFHDRRRSLFWSVLKTFREFSNEFTANRKSLIRNFEWSVRTERITWKFPKFLGKFSHLLLPSSPSRNESDITELSRLASVLLKSFGELDGHCESQFVNKSCQYLHWMSTLK